MAMQIDTTLKKLNKEEQEAPKAEEKKETPPEDNKLPQTPPDEFPSDEYRRVGVNDVERMTESDFEIFKEWVKENLPLIPWGRCIHLASWILFGKSDEEAVLVLHCMNQMYLV